MKTCCVCRQKLPPSQFHKRPLRRGGYAAECMACAQRETRRRRAVYTAARYAELKNDPEYVRQRAAQSAVQYCVRMGWMRKPARCTECGGWPTEGHHEDYSKPLDVVWLCRACHKRRHRKQ